MNEQSLTSEQVDRLLELIDRGELSLDDGPARLYPPRELELGPVQGAVERWVEETARQLENWLIVNVSTQLSCTSGGLVSRVGPIKAPPAALVLVSAGDQEPLLTVWERAIVETVIAGLLGYSFQAANPTTSVHRQLTEIDLRMVQRAAHGLAHAMSVGWPRGEGQVFEVAEVVGDLGSLGSNPGTAPTMACNLMVRMGDDILGAIEFAPPGWVGRALRSDATDTPLADDVSVEMRAVVGSLEVDLDVRVRLGEFTLRQILAFEQGDEFDLPAQPRATMVAGGVVCLEGEPGITEGHWAVAVGSPGEGEEDAE